MKKTIKLLLALVCLLLTTTSIAAEGTSPVKNGTVLGDFTIDGNAAGETHKLEFNSIDGLSDEPIYEVLTKANDKQPLEGLVSLMGNIISSTEKDVIDGKELSDSVIKTVNTDREINLSNAVMLTQFQDLNLFAAGEKIEGKNVQATWEVPNLSAELGDVLVIHYSIVRGAFEIIEPDKVDFENKAITATFEDLSPVAVFYVQAEVKPEPTDLPSVTPEVSEPVAEENEGSNNNFLWLVGLVFVAVVGGVFVFTKKNK